MSLDIGDDFPSRRRAKVLDVAHPVESDTPSLGEFGYTLRQRFNFAVIVRCNVDIDERDLAE
jgi:hypothetical protein